MTSAALAGDRTTGRVQPSRSALWWESAPVEQKVNGVFKGGGAKGVLYGGALIELRDAGYWFRAVAGSSAGAITATLIAAGLSPEQMRSEAPAGLASIRRMFAGDLIGSPLFRTGRLVKWLRGVLREQMEELTGNEPNGDVTLSELLGATGIELYVVAVDVADRQPRVFSAFTTPQLSVTRAVLASSAIPMAFHPGRLEVKNAQGGSAVHRVIDGGVWANYPAFVFREPSFRAFHDLPAVRDDTITMGFTLDTAPRAPAGEAVGFRSNMKGSWNDKGGFLPALFRNPVLRLYFMTVVPLVVVAQTWYTIELAGLVFLKDYATREGVPSVVTSAAAFFDGFFSSFFLGWWSLLGFLVVLAGFLAVLGATFLDSALPAMRTLMSVGTDVPYWVGASDDDHVVRLQVPPWLRTTTFRLRADQIDDAIEIAREAARPQIAAIIRKATPSGSMPEHPPPGSPTI